MVLIVSPIKPRMMMDVRIDSGIEIAMISVDLQLPRKTRIMTAVSAAAIIASRMTPCTAARTKMLWSDSGVIFNCGGTVLATRGKIATNSLDHVQRRGIAALQDRDQHAAAAIQAHDVGLHLKPVADAGNIAQVNGGAVHLLDRDIRQRFHGAR